MPQKVEHIARAKAHIRYKQKSGLIVPGVTTVTRLLTNADVLVAWANRLGLQGYDTKKYVDELATVGTLVHYLIECDLQGYQPNLSDFTANQIEQGQRIFNEKFLEWKAEHSITVVAMEQPLVSELYPFGGTGDFFGYLDDKLTYMDFKTSKACYIEHEIQAVACSKLWEEKTGDTIEDIRILRIGRNMEEGFEDKHVQKWDLRWECFQRCLDVYHLRKKITDGGA